MAGIYTDVRPTEGTDPGSGVSRPDEQAPAMGPSYSQQLLLSGDDKAVFKFIDEIVQSQEQLAKNRDAARKHRSRVRRGVPFSVLNKDEDKNVWTAELPPGVSDVPSPIPNKADDLCRKIVSQVIVDLPQPDPKPATDSEQDRGAADLAKRFLKADGDESGTNDPELFRDALDSAMTDASSFVHVWCDLQGGGWRPLRIKAHPQAQDPANPLVALDPMTGQEIPTSDYVLRYVSESGQFVETAAEAARQWMPKIKRDVLGPQHVRTVPDSADVSSAKGVILLMCGPLSDLKARAPEIQAWGEDQLARLVEWKPRRHKVLVPQALRPRLKEQEAKKGNLKVDDNTLVFWYQKYCDAGNEYPDGASVIVSGVDGGLVMKRETLRVDLPTEDGTVLLRSKPVAQCKALHDSEHRDPMGKAPLDLFGSTNEGLAQLYGAVIQDTDHRLNPNVFIPSTSPVQDWQLRDRRDPITVYSKDDMPMYEEFANLATFTPQVIEMLEESMREAAMLGSTAQVLDSPNAKSGIAKQIEVSQSKVFLAPVAQNFFGFAKRYWRLKLETAQAFLTIPQEVEYVGVDQAYKQRWFKGADFAGVKDVAIQAGSGTMLSITEKQQFLAFGQQAGWIDPDEASEVGRSSMADDMGFQPSPHEDTIKRELAQWMQGPPEQDVDPMGVPQPSWAEQKQAFDQEQMQLQQMAAQNPEAPPMQGQMPQPFTPFVPRPTDDDPSVAMKQYKILRDFIASSDYTKWDPMWRSLVDARYVQARQAAGIMTMQEQAMAQQQQMEQQAMEKDKDRDLKRDEGAANRAAKQQPRIAA